MEFSKQQKRSKLANLQAYQIPSTEASEVTAKTLGNGVDYDKVPKALQKSHFFELPAAPARESVQGKPKGSSTPMRVAQSADVGMDDGFWFKALVGAGLAVYEGNKLITIGSPEAVNALYQQVMKTHQNTTQPPQVLKASQRGRQGNVGDSGIVGEAQELIAQAKAQGKELEMKDALAQLMKKARQSNNGKGDPAREAKIRATQKAEDARGSRESKDGKKKPKGEGKKENKKGQGEQKK
jgi:Bacterial toxin 34